MSGTTTSQAPILYMIRHGEKDPKIKVTKVKDGVEKTELKDPVGLSKDKGQPRAAALVKVFGKDSKYNLGLIIAQRPDLQTLKEARPYLTVQPLAESLQSSGVEFNYEIDSEDSKSVVKAVMKHQGHGQGNILICWEHHNLTNIAREFKMTNAQDYPDDRFDVIWTSIAPYTSIDAITSEHVPGLDDKWANIP